MEHPAEYSLFLSRILSELSSKHRTVSYPELCRSLCSRFDLVHLAKLRSLLFHTASLDPSFPTAIFRERMCRIAEDPQAKKLQVASDIVSMFSLMQNEGPAKDKLHTSRAPSHKNHSARGYERHPPGPHQPSAPTKPVSNSGPHQFTPATDPNFLLRVNKDLKCRAASLDKLHPLPLYSPGTPLGPSCEMQSTYFPMEEDSESTTEPESLPHSGPQEPHSQHSCVHKRNIFKQDFHKMHMFSPKVIRQASECTEHYQQRELQRPAVFFNHSFELPHTNPYVDPVLNSPLQERQRVKHESLDDLQASTYFGPTTVSESVSTRKLTNNMSESVSTRKLTDNMSESVNTRKLSDRPSKQAWPVKSLSLNTEYVSPQNDTRLLNKKPLKNTHVPNIYLLNGERELTKVASPAFPKKINEFKGQDLKPVTNGPRCPEKKEDVKRFEGKPLHSSSFERAEGCSSVGTQTEQGSEQKRLRDFKRSDSEMIRDDISDIFRFLDDMSVCDSLNMVQSSCYNSNGSLSQLTLKSDVDSSPERSTVRLAKSKLDSLFHSLENSDDEVKTNVHRLVLRIGDIEKKLESLSGVRSEISQLLSKLNQLDQKIHKPDDSEGTDPALALHSESGPPARGFQCHTTGHSGMTEAEALSDWSGPQTDWSGPGESLRVKTLKNSLMRRSSRSLNEDLAPVCESIPDWSTGAYCTERPRKNRETAQDRLYDLPHSHRGVTTEACRRETVYAPQAYAPSLKNHVKNSPVYSDLKNHVKNSPVYSELRYEGKRLHPTWTIEEYKRHTDDMGSQLKTLDIQTGEALNPAHLEYWLEDVCTPGYDSLLRRKQADFKRARMCKLGALIAAATCTLILVIVVPICTMKT